MIFVSAGTQDKPFNRLIEGVDRISGQVGEKIIIQTGYSTYVPQNCNFFDFCDQKEMLNHIRSASLVISQAGFGIIGNAIKLEKPMILVPREYKFGEAIDKQYELAEYLAEQNESILCIRDVSQLASAIEKVKGITVHYNYSTVIPELIAEYILQTFPGDA